MGQYYKGFTKTKSGQKSSWKVKFGMKLTEHSYFGNENVLGMCEVIKENPQHVAWVGDYTTTYMEDVPDFNLQNKEGFHRERLTECYKQTWGYDNEKEKEFHKDKLFPEINTDEYIKQVPSDWNRSQEAGLLSRRYKWVVTDDKYYGLFDKYYYLVNHTKKQFINLHEYFYNLKEYHAQQYKNEEMCGPYFHPLPLLTAMGNGLGGGDYYYSECLNKDMIGYWFFDIISVENKDYHISDKFEDITNDKKFLFFEKR